MGTGVSVQISRGPRDVDPVPDTFLDSHRLGVSLDLSLDGGPMVPVFPGTLDHEPKGQGRYCLVMVDSFETRCSKLVV